MPLPTRFNYELDLSVNFARQQDKVEGIGAFVKEYMADMLVLIRQKHYFTKILFTGSISVKLTPRLRALLLSLLSLS